MRCSAANRDVGFVAKAFDDALDLDISKAEDNGATVRLKPDTT